MFLVVIHASNMACAGIKPRNLDERTVTVRTMDFSFHVRSKLIVISTGARDNTLGLELVRAGSRSDCR